MSTQSTTLLVIGGGPGGYVAAIRAGQLGIPTTLVEGDALGGTCLNVGCIPSKALIHAAGEFEQALHHARGGALGIHVESPRIDVVADGALEGWHRQPVDGGVAALLKKSGVQVIRGWARIVDGKTVEVLPEGAPPDAEPMRIGCEHLLLATGSQPAALPALPFGGARHFVDRGVVAVSRCPVAGRRRRRLHRARAGDRLSQAGRRRSRSSRRSTASCPLMTQELTRPVVASLKRLGVQLHLSCAVQGMNAGGDALRVRGAGGARVRAARRSGAGRDWAATAQRGLRASRRCCSTWTAESVRIDDQCRTSMRNVWAIGDLTGEPMLAHRAMAQGEMVAEIIAGQRRRFAPASIPAVCFTDPEVVVAGLSPSAAEAAGLDCRSAMFPFAANGRAMTLESTDGFIRVVARRDNHLIVGWQAVGRGVSELVTAFSQSIEMGARLEDVAGTIHAHPTLGEAVQETALRALGHALHI